MESHVSVAQAAEALGASPQTVRALLRKGELAGEKRPWGSRFVWVVSRDSIDDFLSEYGRLDGRRRSRPLVEPEQTAVLPEPVAPPRPGADPEGTTALPEPVVVADPEVRRRRRLPFFLRARGRASVVVVLVGIPLLVAYSYARIAPGALWFEEVGQTAVFRRLIETQVDFHSRVLAVVTAIVCNNLFLAARGTAVLRRAAGVLAILALSFVVGNLFASVATGQLDTYLLWRHRQPFGRVDPLHGKDIGFFVFSLPFYLALSVWLISLLALTLGVVALTYRARGMLHLRPFRVRAEAQVHLAVLAAGLLAAVAWRLQLQQYTLELEQPSASGGHTFAGAGFVDVHVVSPILTGFTVATLVLAGACLLAPLVARTRLARAGRVVVLGGLVGVTVVGGLVAVLAPMLVQRYVVDPNVLPSEKPYLAASIAGTRAALGLEDVDTRVYEPEGGFDAADFAQSRTRFSRVPTWDTYVLGARMRQLVTDTPYFQPAEPVPDVVRTRDGPRLTAVSARELDLTEVEGEGEAWVSNRLSYTHGMGLLRFSSTEVDDNREPRILDSGLGVRQPRIYYGDLPAQEPPATVSGEVRLVTPTLDEGVAESSWVVANTRRPEVDVASVEGSERAGYHYDGTGGIALSSLARRAVFALALGSQELMFSDEITPESRLLLHRDVHDRLETLAPFIHWDAEAVPLTANGGIVFVVDGYTTSDHYPYAESVALGDAQVSYARASVLATVDAFSGEVVLYVMDDEEPVLRAWRDIFPTLFEPFSQLPDDLRGRLRYPAELFHAQATAYERYHTTRTEVFASGAETWARPLALSGPIEVAGDVDFDESDEDDLRLTMPPVYIWIPPPDQKSPRLVLATYYTPVRGQNLVGGLNGWVDGNGRARLVARHLPREPVTLGPAQVSRVVFATPRVSRLLGLRNLEIRDLDKSSIDAVLLGRPRILLLDGGRVQVQNLYEGSRGPGAARLLGVTAFVNGRAGLGPDVESAVRQALNEPPRVRIVRSEEPVVVGRRHRVAFHVENARREVVTITAPGGQVAATLSVRSGRGSIGWVPTEPGEARVRVAVAGLDGTRTSATRTIQVLGPPPRLRLVDPPLVAQVGRPVRVRFEVDNGVEQLAEVSTRAGIVFSRRFEIRDGRGVVVWVPRATGTARLVIRGRGTEGQSVRRRLSIDVGPSTVVTPPTVTMVRAPTKLTVGEEAAFVFRAQGCRSALVRVVGPDSGVVQEWRLACPADPARVAWTPTSSGDFVVIVVARGESSSSRSSTPVQVREPR